MARGLRWARKADKAGRYAAPRGTLQLANAGVAYSLSVESAEKMAAIAARASVLIESEPKL
jgi:hypothetical protein